ADAYRVLQHRLEHRLKLAWRTGDHTQHLRSGRLLLQRLAQIVRTLPQLVEQACVLDGDDGLVGERGGQLDLLVGKRPDHFACQSEHSDQYPFPQQWHAKQRSVVAKLLCLEPSELRIREDIRYLNRCAFEGDPSGHCPATSKGRCRFSSS